MSQSSFSEATGQSKRGVCPPQLQSKTHNSGPVLVEDEPEVVSKAEEAADSKNAKRECNMVLTGSIPNGNSQSTVRELGTNFELSDVLFR